MKTKAPKKFPFQEELIDLIKKELPLHSIYVISAYQEKQRQNIYLSPQSSNAQKAITYTLLIVCRKPLSKGLGDFMDVLYNRMQQQCKVYAIVYTLSNVIKKLDYGDNFLYQVISKTTCMYKEDDTLSRFKNFQLSFCEENYNNIRETWESRMYRAAYLLSVSDTIEFDEDSISRISIMHYALEQVCLALLFVFWEFKPQHYSLSYLLHLCNHFGQLPQTIFPKETYGLHRIYYMLCNAHHIMRFKSGDEFSDRDADKLHKRCYWFYKEAKSLGEAQLEHLKALHCKPSNPK
tara:strand:- start:1725 stop:2600 length:876 start_codon:yes stop_codon:yes gene_type:complete